MVEVEPFLASLHAPADDIQAAMEEHARQTAFPIIGPLVGRFCMLMATAIGARRVFEMGSGFGYSTLHFARAVGPSGRVVHTDASRQRGREAKAWLERAGLADRVSFRTGDAMDLLEREAGPFDAVFIDVDKQDYPRAWNLAADRVRAGGVILVDNALWQGKAAAPDDELSRAVRRMDDAAFADARFVTSLVPLRDGVLVALRT